MEYRKLPHGEEQISVIGLGFGNIHASSTEAEIEETVRYAVEHSINFFDLCCGNVGVYRAVGKAVKNCREKIYTQMHFGAVYPHDTYERKMELGVIKESFEKVLAAAEFTYTDFGFLHCIDEDEELDKVFSSGIWDYMLELKKQGVIRHLGISTHSPAIAKRMIETGEIDLFMFSLNPAYDYAKGEYTMGQVAERNELYQLAQNHGVGISVMKPFAGGQLLDEKRSPLNVSLTHEQCLQYCLDRPAVLTCLPGVGGVEDVKRVLRFETATAEERDYSVLGKAAPAEAQGRCVYCNHCSPCPMGIDIGLVNKYYDLAKIGDDLAAGHYHNLSKNAADCVQCGHCESTCPFHVKQMARMEEIAAYFA